MRSQKTEIKELTDQRRAMEIEVKKSFSEIIKLEEKQEKLTELIKEEKNNNSE